MADPALADTEWLDPDHLYLATGADCEVDRPVFQGDVFSGIALPELPKAPVPTGAHTIEFREAACMVVPHPCQCYHGDNLRPRLTVAPVRLVENFDNFGDDRSRAIDKFALPSLQAKSDGGTADHVADFGRLQTVPQQWLPMRQRIACLSHQGLGLLAKRVLRFQLRFPTTLTNAMAFTAAEWNESFLMQAWVRTHGSLAGFSEWSRTPRPIPGVNDGRPTAPYDVRAGALDALLELINGTPIEEPEA